MLTLKGIDHIVLRTANVKAMLEFYCDILGCQIEKKQPDIGLTQLRVGNNIIDLVEVTTTSSPDNFNMDHFCLRVLNFDYEMLKKYFDEYQIETYRYGHRYGAEGYGYSFYLKDPDGNEIELKSTHF